MAEGRRLRVALIALLLSSAALFAFGVAKERHDIKREHARAAAAPTGSATKTTTKPTSAATPRTRESATLRSTGSGESTAKRAAEGSGGRVPAETGASAGESAVKRKSEGAGAQTRTNPASTGESAAKLASEGGVESAARLRSEGATEQIFGINTESTALVISAVAVSVLLAFVVWFTPGLAMVLLVVLGLGIASAVFDVREAAHQATENRDTLEGLAIAIAAMHLGVAALAVDILRKRPGRRTATF
jgi:multisubunit Na+/H+ antiporter MnhB subunit